MISDNFPLMYVWRYLVLCDELDFNSNHLAVYLSNFSKTSGTLKTKRSQIVMVTFPRPIYKRITRLNDHEQSQNYTTLDVRQTYHIGDDGARRSILQFYPPSCISLLTSQNVLENSKILKSVAIGISQSLSTTTRSSSSMATFSSSTVQRHRTPTTNGNNVGN